MDVSTSRVVAIFGHKSLFSLDFTSQNGRFYFACSCVFFAKSLCFHWILQVKINVSASSVVANLRVYLRFSAKRLRFHWILPIQWTFLLRV